MPADFEKACFAIYRNSSNQSLFIRETCSRPLKYICETYNEFDQEFKKSCENVTHTWFQAQSECQSKDYQLLQQSEIRPCMTESDYYWMGHFMQQRVIWADNSTMKATGFCLKLIVQNSNHSLEIDSCDRELSVLCNTAGHTTVSKGMNPTEKDGPNAAGQTTVPKGMNQTEKYGTNTEVSTIVPNGVDTEKDSLHNEGQTTVPKGMNPTEKDGSNTEVSTIVPNGLDKTENDSLTPVIAGSAVAISLITAIVVIAVCFVKRRRKMINKEVNTVLATRSDYYSEPGVTYSANEHTNMINVTEEELYNHLGDTEDCIEPKTIVAIYGISGQVENEYDISDASGKRKETYESHDLYGASGINEVGLYDTTKEKFRSKGTESDIYNVVSNS